MVLKAFRQQIMIHSVVESILKLQLNLVWEKAIDIKYIVYIVGKRQQDKFVPLKSTAFGVSSHMAAQYWWLYCAS